MKRLIGLLTALAFAGPALAQDIQFKSAGGAGGGAATTITAGTTVVTGKTDCFGFADGGALFQCDNTLAKLDNSGAGNGTLTIRKTSLAALVYTGGFFNLTGTLSARTSGTDTNAFLVQAVTGDSSNSAIYRAGEFRISGYSGSSDGQTLKLSNTNTGTGTSIFPDSGTGGQFGLYSTNAGTTVGTRVGVFSVAGGGNVNYSLLGIYGTAKDSAVGVGVLGASGSAGATPIRVGVYGLLQAPFAEPTAPTGDTAALFDNGGVAAPIAKFLDAGTEQVRVDDGGDLKAMVTGRKIGSTTNPFQNIVMHLSGTYGTGSWTFAGTPTGNRVLTIPGDASTTIATLAAANNFSSGQTLSAGATVAFNTGLDMAGSQTGGIYSRSALTPDSLSIMTGTLANSLHVNEYNDTSFDFDNGPSGTVAATDPTLIIHSHNQDVTQYTAIAAGAISGGMRKTLTESSATAVVQIPIAASEGTGGVFNYCVFAKDGTDQQQRCGKVKFSVTAKSTTETCGLNTDTATANDTSITETEDGNASSISAGTLTYAITCDTAPTQAVNLAINAVSSLTQTTLEARYSVLLLGPGQVTPQ